MHVAHTLKGDVSAGADYRCLVRLAQAKPSYCTASEGVSVSGTHCLIWTISERGRAWLRWKAGELVGEYIQPWEHPRIKPKPAMAAPAPAQIRPAAPAPNKPKAHHSMTSGPMAEAVS